MEEKWTYKTVWRVVHELKSLFVAFNLHDSDNRTESLFHHDLHCFSSAWPFSRQGSGHTVVNVDEHLWAN
jgi:hypothetical protein